MKSFRASLRVATWNALVALTLLRPSTAHAQANYEAADGCPSQDDFERRISARSPSVQNARVSIRATDGGFVGDLSNGSNVVRRVEGKTCDAVVDALALAVTLGATGAEDPSPEDEPTPPSSAETSPGDRTAKTARSEERPPNAPPEPDDRKRRAREDDRKASTQFSLELNPLSLLIGRYSLTGELHVARGHAITLTPYVVSTSGSVSNLKNTGTYNVPSVPLTAFGGEVGYRYYPLSRPSGPYLGVSALLGHYLWTVESKLPSGSEVETVETMSIGGALDVGGKVVFGPGIVIGGGVGVQYTAAERKAAPIVKLGDPLVATSIRGMSPRLLFAVGYTF